MSTTRPKRKPVFDPSALDDDLDEMWPARKPAVAAPPRAPAPAALPASATVSAPVGRAPVGDPPPRPAAPESKDDASSGADRAPRTPAVTAAAGGVGERPRRLTTVAPAGATAAKRTRPPEVLLSSEVYEELYRVQIAEKKLRRGLARPMGAIVLDAIEAHASVLATTWVSVGATVGEGQLFERPSSNAVPRRRRHATAPRTIVLSGVTGANGQRLDDLVQAWDAGTRSALVEQALRYEFGLLPG